MGDRLGRGVVKLGVGSIPNGTWLCSARCLPCGTMLRQEVHMGLHHSVLSTGGGKHASTAQPQRWHLKISLSILSQF